jgi:hypothetical protein
MLSILAKLFDQLGDRSVSPRPAAKFRGPWRWFVQWMELVSAAAPIAKTYFPIDAAQKVSTAVLLALAQPDIAVFLVIARAAAGRLHLLDHGHREEIQGLASENARGEDRGEGEYRDAANGQHGRNILPKKPAFSVH